MLPFLLDELIVFGLAVVTLRATKMQEKHGRVLKLVAGTMMLALAITVLVSPEAMSDPLLALLVFGVAFGAAAPDPPGHPTEPGETVPVRPRLRAEPSDVRRLPWIVPSIRRPA